MAVELTGVAVVRTHEDAVARRDAERRTVELVAHALVTDARTGTTGTSTLIANAARTVHVPRTTVAQVYWEMARRGWFDLDGHLTARQD